MAFVYYWYETYVENKPEYDLANQKNKLLQQSLRDFKQRKQLTVKSGNLSAKEAGDLIGCLIGDKEYLDSLRSIFEANFDSYGLSNESWKKRGAEITSMAQANSIINNNSKQIQEAIDVFQQDLTKALDEIYSIIGSSSSLTSLIADQIRNKRDEVSDIGHPVIEKFFRDYMAKTKDGLHTVLAPEDSMDKLLMRCSMIARGIRVLGSQGQLDSITTGSGSKAKTVTNAKLPDCFEIIGGKLDGLMRNIKGLAAEMALAQAFKDGETDMLKALQKVKQDWIPNMANGKGDFSVSAQVMGEDYVATTKGDKSITVRAKSDVSVEITANGITIFFGVSVKQYTLEGSAVASTTVSLSNNTTFDRALRYATARAGLPYENIVDYAYNIGGGHLPTAGKKVASEEDLEKRLNALKEFTIYGSLLEMLAGTALTSNKGNSDNVIFFSLNGKIFPVNEILGRVLAGKDKGGMELANTQVRGLTRSNMKKHNKYVPKNDEKAPRVRHKMVGADTKKAEERSTHAISEYQRLMNTKININMSILNKLVM